MDNVKELDKETMDEFHKAYSFLSMHPIYTRTDSVAGKYGTHTSHYFRRNTDIEVVKVNPMTGQIDDNHKLNTKTDVWLESGPVLDDSNEVIHDIDLDCGADTYEEAIIELAKLVKEKYGDYELYSSKDFYRIRQKVNEKPVEEVINNLYNDLSKLNMQIINIEEQLDAVYDNTGVPRVPHKIINDFSKLKDKKKSLEEKIENLKNNNQ